MENNFKIFFFVLMLIIKSVLLNQTNNAELENYTEFLIESTNAGPSSCTNAVPSSSTFGNIKKEPHDTLKVRERIFDWFDAPAPPSVPVQYYQVVGGQIQPLTPLSPQNLVNNNVNIVKLPDQPTTPTTTTPTPNKTILLPRIRTSYYEFIQDYIKTIRCNITEVGQVDDPWYACVQVCQDITTANTKSYFAEQDFQCYQLVIPVLKLI